MKKLDILKDMVTNLEAIESIKFSVKLSNGTKNSLTGIVKQSPFNSSWHEAGTIQIRLNDQFIQRLDDLKLEYADKLIKIIQEQNEVFEKSENNESK